MTGDVDSGLIAKSVTMCILESLFRCFEGFVWRVRAGAKAQFGLIITLVACYPMAGLRYCVYRWHSRGCEHGTTGAARP
jgi:hypothetical protein